MGKVLAWILIICGGFLLGDIMFCSIVPRLFAKKDICELHGDKNPGAANVFSSCGIVMGIICLLLDMLKGFLPVFIGGRILNTESMPFAAVIVAPVLGHALGLFNRFRGGKCIATSFGVVIGLLPLTWVGWILAALYIVFSTVIKINPHRRRSIFTFTIFGALSCIILIVQGYYPIAIGCLLLSAVAVIKHLKYFSPDETIETETIIPEEEEPAVITEIEN